MSTEAEKALLSDGPYKPAILALGAGVENMMMLLWDVTDTKAEHATVCCIILRAALDGMMRAAEQTLQERDDAPSGIETA